MTFHSEPRRTAWRLAMEPRASGIVVAALVGAILLTFAVLISTLNPYGLDITDEGYYLLSADAPAAITASLGFFGWILRPLWLLADGSLQSYRLLGFTIVLFGGLATGVSLALLVLRRPWGWDHTLLALLAAFVALPINLFIPTPGYNHVALLAACLFAVSAAALLPLTPQEGRLHWIPTIAGLGLAGAGMLGAKFSMLFATAGTLLLLALTAGGFALWRREALNRTAIAAATAMAALYVLTAWAFLKQSESGVTYFKLLASHNAEQLLQRDLSHLLRIAAAGLAGMLAASLGSQRTGWLVRGPALALGCAAIAADTVSRWQEFVRPLDFLAVMFVSYAAGALATHAIRQPTHDITSRALASVIALVSASLAFTVGTANELTFNLHFALPLLALAAGIITIALVQKPILRHGIIALLAAIVIQPSLSDLLERYRDPYRSEGPIASQMASFDIRPGRPHLFSERVARQFEGLRAGAEAAKFRSGTPIIDLTGGSPGTVFVLNGRPVVVAWLLGAYPGSLPAAAYALPLAARNELNSAWVLKTKIPGARSISPSVLVQAGLPFPEGYRLVASGGPGYRNETHELWAPAAP